MPKVTHVKKARKDHPDAGIKKGEEYWHWGTKVGSRFVTRYSKKKPRPSQLTNSEFLSSVFGLQEMIEDSTPTTVEEFNSLIEDVRNELESIRDTTQEKFENLPENLQESSSGELLQGRIDSLEDVINDLEELDEPDDDSEEEESIEEAKQSLIDKIGGING